MNAHDIITLLTDITADKQHMLDALQDGALLQSLGITDDDTEAVECAYAIVTQAINDKYAWLE